MRAVVIALARIAAALNVSRPTARRALAEADLQPVRLVNAPNSTCLYDLEAIRRWAHSRGLPSSFMRELERSPNQDRARAATAARPARSISPRDRILK